MKCNTVDFTISSFHMYLCYRLCIGLLPM
uniref:Uncharacterized protein n=1 Tax=Rhizophora mucronata TaxID=61149 RepID=A0A2P2Q9Z3_RHIMU